MFLRRSLFLVAFVFGAWVALFTGCAKDSSKKSSASQPPAVAGLGALSAHCDKSGRAGNDGPFLDPAMTESDCDGIHLVYTGLTSAQLSPKADSEYDRIFVGTDGAAAAKFINERMHYILPSSDQAPVIIHIGGLERPQSRNTGNVVASNWGVGMWEYKKKNLKYDPNLSITLGKTSLDIDSPQGGYVELGENFSKFDLVIQMMTLVHEARHSDCDDEKNEKCGFSHADCPEGHDYAGQPACDNGGVGAYYVAAVYGKTISDTCSNCSSAEREGANIFALDSLSRVLDLDDVRAGKVGPYTLALYKGFDPSAHRQNMANLRAVRAKELGVDQ